MILKLEDVNYARRHQYGGGKPRNEIVQPSLAGAVPHGIAPRGAATGTAHQRSVVASVSSPRVTSTLDERDLWEAVGHPADQRRCGCMDTTSREKLEKLPEQENYMVWPGIILGSSQWRKDAWYEGAGIDRGGVSLHGT
jgi:hypothetical protein